MSISASIKALLSIKGMRQSDLMDVLNVGSKQALSNKFVGGRWSASDLVTIAEFAGCKLAFILPDGERVLISADPVQTAPVGDSAGAASGVVGVVSTDKQ